MGLDREPADGILACDVSLEGEVEAAIARVLATHGRIDDIVHAAGVVGSAGIEATSLAEWESVLVANLTSAFLLLRACAAPLRQARGRVVLVASSNALDGGSPLSGPAYAAAKAGVVNLVRHAAKDWRKAGVRVNGVAPGPVDTPMLHRLAPEVRQRLASQMFGGRPIAPEEVAGAVLFLLSDHAGGMTGTTLNLSGGLVPG